MKQVRLQAEADYRLMVELVNALVLINGDAAYATFIDHVNVFRPPENSNQDPQDC
ncbi:DUF6261 family protein [Parabacteroides faecis]|uniref:Uncharacterized protein n=1 Tax=Parabacteroides faecis TaxID=1217282 RepID=A0ABR6KG22_9BACT|nr:DUF6261 family protein [Parabacteroides faecis]MBB4620451.1 hypothetical protein [Parabacteroides faecis]GGK04943.1 hypothetical protein GCM10007084_30220 [Parabacteroides faecis]